MTDQPMIAAAQARRLAEAAYEAGWHDHFRDTKRQADDPKYPIGGGKRTKTIAAALDPHGILQIGADR